MNKLDKTRPSIDDIDGLIQKKIAKKIYKYIGKKNLFVWKDYRYVESDIGGKLFNVCPYCGGKKEFENGYQNYDDNTEQDINCKLCGWKGYRLIKISSWSNDIRTSYRKSVCVDCRDFEEKTKNKEYFNCKPIIIEAFHIDWKERRVFFEIITREYEKVVEVVEVLDFETAHKVFVLFELYNKEVQVESLDHLLSQATLNYNES